MKYIPIILCLILPFCGFTAWQPHGDGTDDGADSAAHMHALFAQHLTLQEHAADPAAHMRAIIIKHLYDEGDKVDEVFMAALGQKCMDYAPDFIDALLQRICLLIPFYREPCNIPLCLAVFDRAALWAQGPGRDTQWNDADDLLTLADGYCAYWTDDNFMANFEDVLNGTYVPDTPDQPGRRPPTPYPHLEAPASAAQ